MNKIIQFYEGIRKEMSKVSWPERKELVDNTTVTLVFSILLSIFIFLTDRVWSSGLEFIFNIFK